MKIYCNNFLDVCIVHKYKYYTRYFRANKTQSQFKAKLEYLKNVNPLKIGGKIFSFIFIILVDQQTTSPLPSNTMNYRLHQSN